MEKGGDIGMMGKGFHSSKLIEKKSRKVVEIPLYKRIGLTAKQFNDDDIIKPHEREFVRKFTKLGHRIRWIVRDKTAKDGVGYLPTNDFMWRRKEWELKSPKVKRYNSIFNMIRRGARKGKENFMIDLGKSVLQSNLFSQLSTYNTRNPNNQIKLLYVVDKESLTRVSLN